MKAHNRTPEYKEEYIKYLLEDFNISQQEIVELAGVSQCVVGRILKELSPEFRKARYSAACKRGKLGDKNHMFGKIGKKHHNYKDSTKSSGYLLVDRPDWWEGHCPRPNKVFAHHYNWCSFYNQTKVPSELVIHHIDTNKSNNDITNLQLLTRKEHALVHSFINFLTCNDYPEMEYAASAVEARST